MTTILLVRHGAHALGGETIAGRMAGVHLSELGRQQAAALADRLARLPIGAIYSSPVDRARETAGPLAERLGLPVEVHETLSEIDFGDWTGRRLDELRLLAQFQEWNQFRSGTRVPNGESMVEVQARMVAEMTRLRERHPDGLVACFGHGDPIKAAIAHWLGVPLDLLLRIEISLASVSVVVLGHRGPWVLAVNHTSEIVLPK